VLLIASMLGALMMSACASAPQAPAGSAPARASTSNATASGTAGAGASTSAQATASTASGTGASVTTGPGDAGTVTAPQGGAGPAHPSANATLAAPGTYSYTVSGSATGSDTVLVANQATGSTVDQHATLTDNGSTATSEYTWSSASALLIDVQTKGAQGSADCRFSKPIAEEQFPLASDASWHSDATCAVSQGAVSGTIHWSEADTVSGTTTVSVDGTAVACWTITRQITVVLQGSGPNPQSQTSNITQVDAYAPDLGLPARTTVTSKGSSRTLTLQHLHPS
jgi:hypothetical protein